MKLGQSRALLVGSAAIGMALLAWTVWSVGPARIADQFHAVRSALPIVFVLAAVRFVCQAAGWRLAMKTDRRPNWTELFTAVIAGEGAGYFAWGSISREPLKAVLVSHRLPTEAGLAAALAERLAYTLAATVLATIALGVIAVSHGWASLFGIALALTLIAAAVVTPRLISRSRLHQPRILWGLAALASAQELINVLEAWLVLTILGVTPDVLTVVIFEGTSRLLNAGGQLVPGKLGVSEAASAMIAGALRIGSTHGLSLALARRARSLAWSAVGMAILVYRASFVMHSLEARAASHS
jgi:Lysylphosphatidylglycerol synthase TM region